MNSSSFSSETGQKPEPDESDGSRIVNQVQEGADEVRAETVIIDRGGANSVRGETVNIEQGGANSVTADHLIVRQGGVVKVDTQKLEMLQGGIVLAQTQTAHLTASNAGFLLARGEVKMDQSEAKALVASGNVTMNQSGAVLMVAQDVKADKSGVVFLFARKIEGSVSPMFGPRESILFGVVSGMVAGLVLLLGKQMKLRKRIR